MINIKNNLINNIEKIHTTKLGKERIMKNLNNNNVNIIDYLKKLLLTKESMVYQKGKNYYCEIDNIIITINFYNYTIITAHMKEEK